MRSSAILMTAVMTLAMAAPANAGATPAQKCQAAKEKASGKQGQCHAKVNSKAVGKGIAVDPAAQDKCDAKTGGTFDKADAKGGLECLTTGDGATMSAALQECMDEVTTLIHPGLYAPGNPRDKCDSKKIKTAGGYLNCKYKARATAVSKGQAEDFSKCESKLASSIDKANEGLCSVEDDLASIKASIDQCVASRTLTGVWGPTTATATMDCGMIGPAAVALPVVFTVTPDQAIVGGTTVGATLDVSVVISEASTVDLVNLLNAAMIPTTSTIHGSTIDTSAISGAVSANPQQSVLMGPIVTDLDTDPDLNGLPGPHVFLTPAIVTSYDVALAATSLDLKVNQVEVLLETDAAKLLLSTDAGATPPMGYSLQVCTLTPAVASLPVQYLP